MRRISFLCIASLVIAGGISLFRPSHTTRESESAPHAATAAIGAAAAIGESATASTPDPAALVQAPAAGGSQPIDLDAIFPPSELPTVATAEGAAVSLRYLAQNGADLTKPMPSKHCVFAANEQVAVQWLSWARQNQFEVRGPEVVRDHLGTPRQRLELVRTRIPDPQQIEREGRQVLAGVRQIAGSYYQTWAGEIVP